MFLQQKENKCREEDMKKEKGIEMHRDDTLSS